MLQETDRRLSAAPDDTKGVLADVQVSNEPKWRRVISGLRPFAKKALNGALAPFDIKIVGTHDWSNTRDFIPFEKTIDAAKRSGLSVGDYIDAVMNATPGATQSAVEEMSRLGVFAGRIESVVEIGPGSGRLLEKTLAACSPARCEIYETAGPWATYLVSRYDVMLRPTDGKTLSATPDESVDLVQAYKVFCSIPFVETCSYWSEMARVTRSGGFAVFDVMTEQCLDSETFQGWLSEETGNGAYPAIMPRSLAVGYFEGRGFELLGSFFVPMRPGRTETFVFRRL